MAKARAQAWERPSCILMALGVVATWLLHWKSARFGRVQLRRGNHCDIFEIEAIGLALALYNVEEHLSPNALWMRDIDNDATLLILVKDSLSVLSGEVITAYTNSRVAAVGLSPWFDRVASAANPADQLSHRVMDQPWRLMATSCAPVLFTKLRTCLMSS